MVSRTPSRVPCCHVPQSQLAVVRTGHREGFVVSFRQGWPCGSCVGKWNDSTEPLNDIDDCEECVKRQYPRSGGMHNGWGLYAEKLSDFSPVPPARVLSAIAGWKTAAYTKQGGECCNVHSRCGSPAFLLRT